MADEVLTGIPLSLQQQFFCSLDRGDAHGAFGSRHVASSAWRVRGRLDVGALRESLDDVVERHEILRTSIARDVPVPYQTVHPPGPVRLTVHEFPSGPADDPGARAEEWFNEIESLHHPVAELPHLRAALGRFGADDAVLVLTVHHVAADGWSMRLIMRDLLNRYAHRCGHTVPALPEARQYREYAALSPEEVAGGGLAAARAHWRNRLRGAEMTAVGTDRLPAGRVPAYGNHRFLLDETVTGRALAVARSLRCTPFMIFMAAYALLLRELTGRDEVVAGTFSSGRGLEGFRDTVGPFLNFLPLRIDLSGCAAFRDVAARTRATCLDAYTHDIPFGLIEEEVPGLMDAVQAPGRELIAFEVLQFPPAPTAAAGGLAVEEIRRRVLSQEVSCDIPDGGLWALDVLPSGETACSLKLDANVFDAATGEAMARAFERILRSAVTAPEDPLPARSRR
ncbi:condensation domain-containing protein [Actinomadura nitritigenes]|uniref:condensation domain-containing protein n=1 Tax=Actinomadura nitritigenes TaxID=134602 RepID=UPI003D9317C2